MGLSFAMITINPPSSPRTRSRTSEIANISSSKMADQSEEHRRSIDLSRVKNKVRRSALFKQEKHLKNKDKREKKKKRKREEEELGDEVRRE